METAAAACWYGSETSGSGRSEVLCWHWNDQAVQKFDDRTGKIQYGGETSGSGRSEVLLQNWEDEVVQAV